MSFRSLPTGKLYKPEKLRLKKLPAGCIGRFCKNLADNVDIFLDSQFYGSIANEYIHATSDFAKGIQTDFDHYVKKDRINNASFRQKLDPISKNIIRDKIHSNLFLEIFQHLMQKIQLFVLY